MLAQVKAYSSLQEAETIYFDEDGRAETDPIQIRNIEGLEPVKASVNTSPLAGDGVSYTGSNIPSRNIVLTLHPNPDWDWWTPYDLRKLIYSYFTPKSATRLEFYSDDIHDLTFPVGISGIVEDVSANSFSDDPEILVSIICPDPYFVALEPIVITGESIRPVDNLHDLEDIEYYGTIECGIQVKVNFVSGSVPTSIGIQLGDPGLTYFNVNASVDDDKYFEMCSIPRQKFVRNINTDIAPSAGVITSLLSEIEGGSTWPVLKPGSSSYSGSNKFGVITDVGVQDWELTYLPRFVGL